MNAPSPFFHIDAGEYFRMKLNVMTSVQRNIIARSPLYLGKPFFFSLMGESGAGKTHTLKACKTYMQKRLQAGKHAHLVYVDEGYLSYENLFQRLHPHLSLKAIESMVPASKEKYVFFIDLPNLCAEKDMIHSLEFLDRLRHPGNVSFIVSLPPSHLSGSKISDLVRKLCTPFMIPPLAGEEEELLFVKRLNGSRFSHQFVSVDVESDKGRLAQQISINSPRFTAGTFEEIHRISRGNPRLALITASTLYEKGLAENCRMIDGSLIRSLETQNGYDLARGGCLLRTGLRTLLEVFVNEFLSVPVPEHLLLSYMGGRFGWNVHLTEMRLKKLVNMKFLDTYLKPSRGWFREYRLRD